MNRKISIFEINAKGKLTFLLKNIFEKWRKKGRNLLFTLQSYEGIENSQNILMKNALFFQQGLKKKNPDESILFNSYFWK